ncbi:hypothetical protein BDW02DRAFT_602470 [Decorospora gaudefroyi]|uniref:DUF7730 domain-containing protein n=1 Tax=Decorospora gaudefroyi TaxID=184978 RepID=A0A6A5K4X6_9PLEO|nr:hypothetical protein BDW02DRAFT_602470 [Decorospora gaudefroyi]
MGRKNNVVLGKRGRRSMVSDQVEAEEQDTTPKRSRTQDAAENEAADDRFLPPAPSTAPPPCGLLTPEPSILTESQVDTLPATATVTVTDDMPAARFPFMKLPAELRIHIYHMALVREEPLLLHAHRAPEPCAQDELAPTPPASRTWHNDANAPVQAQSEFYLHPRSHSSGPERVPLRDPIVPELLRLNKLTYKEARQVLYSDNVFTLSLSSGVHTLSSLHQRSRSLIKHVVLNIPSHHDILEGFSELVRLGLRYCWGLKTFHIILQTGLPDDGRTSATSVYANAFHILRWLPRGCKVGLEGRVSDSVRQVVDEEGRLQSVLDEASYLKRQHQMPERH